MTGTVTLRPWERRIVRNPWFRRNYSRIRVRGGYLLAAALLLAADQPLWPAGLVITSLGLLIRIWAAGYLVKNKELSTMGPYGVVRHPLYLGSFLIGLGLTSAVGSCVLTAVYLVSFGIIYHLTMLVEETRMEKLFPDQYQIFHNSTGRLMPRLDAFRRVTWRSWRPANLVKNREYRQILGSLAILVLLLLRQQFLPPLP
ncbi:isoprenylcysteine carboxylmethyltransferase family protein [bacterium]|nr:isoprenylcysteine carboxylmethyltransferase family protein [candidate division CSSED10-310 bacterium]